MIEVFELNSIVEEADNLRFELFCTLNQALKLLNRSLSVKPAKPSSSYWKRYGDYWQAYVIFRERLGRTVGEFHQEFVLPELLQSTSTGDTFEDWLDLRDEVLETYRSRKYQRQDLLTVIELFDSTQRLAKLTFPPVSQSAVAQRFDAALQKIRRTLKHISQLLQAVLEKVGVQSIPLQQGEYPSPELTRIFARRDDGRDDNVIIDEVVQNGYLWENKLLRKADVIVITAQGRG